MQSILSAIYTVPYFKRTHLNLPHILHHSTLHYHYNYKQEAMAGHSGPDEPQTAAEQRDQQVPTTAAVAIRPPPFSANKLQAYFRVLEAQLTNANITSGETKFRHLLSNLPVDVVDKLTDEQASSNDYDQLKQTLISLYSKPDPQIFNELLTIPSSLTTKPTIFLQQLRAKCSQLNLSDDFLKVYFIQTMPTHVRPTLVTHSGTIEDLAKLADTLIDYNLNSYNNVSMPFNPISHVNSRSQHAPLLQQNSQQYSSRPTFSSYNSQHSSASDNNYTSPSIPTSLRAFHGQQKPRVCRSHLWFGHQARKCKPWCMLNNNTLPLAPNSRPSSRSSSPVRNPQSGNA